MASRRRLSRTSDPSPDYLTQVAEAVGEFGAATSPLLRRGIAEREAAIREPFVRMLTKIAEAFRVRVRLHPEARIATLSVRPDYAVDVSGAPVGHVELKAPGKGAPQSGWRPSRREKEQWEKLRLLPNVLYGDGTAFGLYRWGEPVGDAARLSGDPATEGRQLRPVDSRFAALLQDFLLWSPDPGPTLDQLIRNVAGLCRLLRDEVIEALQLEHASRVERIYSPHLRDWRAVWSQSLSEHDFGDAFAQTITFGLLLARSTGVAFEGRGIPDIGEKLTKNHLLVGRALSILTSRSEGGRSPEEHSTVIQTLRRVIEAVRSPDLITGGARSVHLLYETFLERYDRALRRRSGSYYTPRSLSEFMVRFVDEVVRTKLTRRRGLAEPDVVIVDPAMGTGTFLTQVVDRVANVVEADGGDVPAALRELLGRLIGFEWQVSPFAVAELQMHLELARHGVEAGDEKLRLHIADTLSDSDTLPVWFPAHYDPIARSMERANHIKSEERVMVVLGNPPYLERARKLGGSVVDKGLIDDFRRPGLGRLEFKLHNLNVYFWRWATWKVFDAHHDQPEGVIAFVTTSAFTTGPGFAGMREYLRRQADEGWIVDLSPEGHQPPVETRLFPGVQRPICVGVFVRRGSPRMNRAAKINYVSVNGHRDQKAQQLSALGTAGPGWKVCSDVWTAPMRPIGVASWLGYPLISDLLPWSSPGVKPNRTWVYAPDRETLIRRWGLLIAANQDEKRSLLKETPGREIHRVSPAPSPGAPAFPSLADERSIRPTNISSIAYRSFDRQVLLRDSRVVDRERLDLWRVHGGQQTYVTALHADAVKGGPAVTVCSDVPDMHHHSGRGGRVHPLFRGADGRNPNLPSGLVTYLTDRLGIPIAFDEVFAYMVGVLAHSGFSERFVAELRDPGVRIPLAADPDLWREAVRLGRHVICLHTYGERCPDAAGDWRARRPRVLTPIPGSADEMPETMSYDDDAGILQVGSGRLGPVSRGAWEYHVSGMRVIRKWFSYRKKVPDGRWSSPLDDVNAERWTNDRTEQLRDLIAVVEGCVALEDEQTRLLDRICAGPLITMSELESSGVLPVAPADRKPLLGERPRLFG